MTVTIGTSTWPVKIWDAGNEFIWYVKPQNIPEVWRSISADSQDLPSNTSPVTKNGSVARVFTLQDCQMPPDTASGGNWEKLKRAFRYWDENDSLLTYDEYVGTGSYDVGTWSTSAYTGVEDVTVKIEEIRITSKTFEQWEFTVTLKKAS